MTEGASVSVCDIVQLKAVVDWAGENVPEGHSIGFVVDSGQ